MLIETTPNTFLIPTCSEELTLKKVCEKNWVVCSGESKSVFNIRNGVYFEKKFSSLMEVEDEYPNLKGISLLINNDPISFTYH